MLRNLLRKIGLSCPPPPSDQTYYEANVENALVERDKIIDRVIGIAESSNESNEAVRAGIASVRSSSSRDVMAELVHGMKYRRN
jgi:hypothetical protein